MKNTENEVCEVPTTPNLDWILHQLANDHGIERDKSEIYWMVYANAGRCKFTALDMIDEIANDPIVLFCFAQSVVADQPTESFSFGRHVQRDGLCVGIDIFRCRLSRRHDDKRLAAIVGKNSNLFKTLNGDKQR